MIATMSGAYREKLIEAVRKGMRVSPDGRVAFLARAHAIKGCVAE